MKFDWIFICSYCDSPHGSGFLCTECEIFKCDDCASRLEISEGICVECLQNSAPRAGSYLVQIIIPGESLRSGRVLSLEAASLDGVLRNSLKRIQEIQQPAKPRELLLRIRFA
jgi:hypothetical protein